MVECVGPLHNLEGQHTYAINTWYPPFLFNTMLQLSAIDDSIAYRIFYHIRYRQLGGPR